MQVVIDFHGEEWRVFGRKNRTTPRLGCSRCSYTGQWTEPFGLFVCLFVRFNGERLFIFSPFPDWRL